MARVITFSRQYPVYHPKAGQPTHFVEKIWQSLIECGLISISKCVELSRETGIGELDMYSIRKIDFGPKYHTIRAGERWNEGDMFSPRVWSGKPYRSKMIQIAPDIQVKKVIHIFCDGVLWFVNRKPAASHVMDKVAANDGLLHQDLLEWFKWPSSKHFSGQIICWDENVNY